MAGLQVLCRGGPAPLAPQCPPGLPAGPRAAQASVGGWEAWLSVEGGGTWLSLGMGWWHVAVLKAERLWPRTGTLKPWAMPMGVRLWFGVQILTPCVSPPVQILPPLGLQGCGGSPGAGWVPDVGSGGLGRTRGPGEAGGSLG